MSDRREQHPISLKVMRLYKPAWSSTTASPDQCVVPMRALDSELLLPDSFNKIYTGQLFSSYICLVNTGQHPVANVNVVTDLQSPRRKTTLTKQRSQDMPCHCQPQQTLQVVVSQEILEPGTHTLRVVVEYDAVTTRERKSFRKFYRFNVDHPFALKTAVRALPYVRRPELDTDGAPTHPQSTQSVTPDQDWYAVEVTLTNLTEERVTIESVNLTPTRNSTDTAAAGHAANTLAERVQPDYEDLGSEIQLGPPSLRPKDEYNAVFIVRPQSHKSTTAATQDPGAAGKAVGDLGTCSLVWCTASGERGRLSSPPIKRAAGPTVGGGPGEAGLELTLSLLGSSQVTVGEEFMVQCVVQNRGLECQEARLVVDSASMAKSGICVTGSASTNLGPVVAGASVERVLRCIATSTGLHALSGIAVHAVSPGGSPALSKPHAPRKGPMPILVLPPVC